MVHDQKTNLDLLSCCAIPVWWTSAVSNIDLKYGTLYSSLDIWKVPCLRWSVLNHCLPATPKGLRSPDVSFLVLLSRSSMRPTRTIWQTKLIFSRFRSSLPRSCIATTNHTSSHYTKKYRVRGHLQFWKGGQKSASESRKLESAEGLVPRSSVWLTRCVLFLLLLVEGENDWSTDWTFSRVSKLFPSGLLRRITCNALMASN